jgi:hypothetical protein
VEKTLGTQHGELIVKDSAGGQASASCNFGRGEAQSGLRSAVGGNQMHRGLNWSGQDRANSR